MPEISTGGITNVASVADAINASDLQIFTREGRHIAGVAFTDAQITEFMTSANGFDDSAVYSAEYLNNTTSAYRGIDMDVSFSGGMHFIKIGSNGVAPSLAQGTTIVPGNATVAQTMSVALSDGSSLSVPITVGASASSAAHSFNEVLRNSGVRAEAKTQVELFAFPSNGVVSFDLEVANRVPIEISADVTPSNLSNLAIALNKVSNETGVVAVTSSDNARIILTSDDGDDIVISKLGATSPLFFGRFVDDNGVAETSPIGTISVSGAFKTPLTSTTVVTDALLQAHRCLQIR